MTPPSDTTTDQGPTRADRFARDLAALKIPDPTGARHGLWLRTGAILLLTGLVLGALTYPLAHATENPLAQRDALAIGLTGVVCAVVGGVLYLRYSLTGFLRFWLARQAYDLSALGDRLTADPTATVLPATEGEPRNGATSTASR
ncbi:hypothetical protein [Streptomyces sp. NL15-2K]|uniref:hypothetical protein n=1 Tax=Streptomyces sp. NL15-2K TaxID=376149 RepID=UPI000F57EE45|nr:MULTISPECIES: hypothetical protein [Actinomycetes]WKX15461.1 hypothetical protein Q4V64_51385 [Kutzneria buriramensis]GCB52646.1 hypothetical protein SNL152K_10003 [Streptomyces sp. NL15-2K]